MLYLLYSRSNSLHISENIFISYGLGIGFISLEMLILHLLNIKFAALNITAPWLVLVLINIVIYIKRGKRKKDAVRLHEPKTNKFGILKAFLCFGIIFEISYAIFRALIKPIESFDAIAIYAIRSKIFYLAKSFPANYFAMSNGMPHPEYPLNIPLIQTFIYLCLGSLNDLAVKIIFPLYFIGILVVLYFAIRRFAGSTYALIFTFMLASIQQFNVYASNAYLDLPLSYYCLISVIFLFEWFKQKERFDLLIVSAVMAAIAAWTKNEGLMYCVINTAVMVYFLAANRKNISTKDIIAPFLYVAVIFTILLPWLVVKHSAHLVSTDVAEIYLNPLCMAKQLYKFGPILYEFQREAFGPKKWNMVWIAVLFAAAFNFKKIFRGELKYVSIMLMLTVCGYVYFYLISSVEITFFLTKTWSRFLIHFLPIAVYWLALILKDDIKI